MSLPFCPEKLEMWNSPEHDVRLVSGVRENGLEVHTDIRKDSLTKNLLPVAPKSPDSFTSTGTVPPFLLTPLPLITDSKLHLLWPQPQEILQTEGAPFRTRGTPLPVVLDAGADTTLHASLDIWDVHQENFASNGVGCVVEDVVCPEATESGIIFCHLSPGSHARFESYKLIIKDKRIRILSPDVIGLHYALCTLGQLFSLYNEDGEICVPALYIHDWPQLQHRAVLLDFSPAARKPDLETLKGYIKVMSLLKLRQLHCCYNLESGFPFSNRALLDLARHCRRHFVDIIPVVESDKEVTAEDVGQSLHCLVKMFSTKKVQVGPNLSKKVLASKEMMSHLPMLLSNCKIFLFFDPAAESLSMLPLSYAFVEDTSRVEQDFDSGAKDLMLAG
ncbi:uncharacterized protein LOC129216191 isoform X1 [Uloborus diversus]|nr:uncharacterized protein LOC129216191 isoform X1 [Uloborus diversus]